MPTILVFDQDGTEHKLSAQTGDALMEPLRDAGLVQATCGGAASCGTCHVYLRDGWRANTGEYTEDEGYMLEGLEELVEVNDKSRLACQINLTDSLDGITLDIAPQI
ncbi:2Fe-2S iron-sulfur cluster-binding protein [Parasphingorhabdus halotolerans]|uniref:2Fe-2S iron-sulfur cluster binding domain-containing protein n=1 Tax=Parasphingorhabdus halotolerans TaxID=2725558 RepID=A0A6H2DJB0_9SPHN|nr:2Fe-2S iron-sulfur cluster-binding protein [Parasphingorhabdus halotolerans]QJB68769.1 2Fe-2S iron-sulfur cluster binding domain-containing protein [Parasphingorhabdus halotolerans]